MAREKTVESIRAAALRLFSTQWYEAVSVANICREAGVSNGVFYRYYPGKEAIFEDLLEDFLTSFGGDLQEVGGTSREERLSSFIATVSGAARRYAGQVTMFREGQYRRPLYERRLRELYIGTLEEILARQVDEAEYLYVLSGLRFISTRSLYHDLPIDASILLELIEEGVFPEGATLPLREPPLPERPGEGEEKAPDSGEALLNAGLKLLGQKNFFDVQVTDIARAAGFSVGTFYKRFESKEAYLAEIVHRIGSKTRHYLTEHAPVQGNRLDREVHGMWNFLSYFRHHREYYDIVREAEFVVPEAVRDYYDAFERGYAGTLPSFPEGKRRLVANFLMGLSHYLGIEVLFSDRAENPKALIERLGVLLERGIGGEA